MAIGYTLIRIDGRPYYAHRLIWIWHHGSIPIGMEIDHERGDKSDNRIEHLRLVTHAENGKNLKKKANNTSGITGVRWHRASRSWFAAVDLNGVRNSLGYFKDKADAAIRVRTFYEQNGFSDTHGLRA